jgi:hypothetical protein
VAQRLTCRPWKTRGNDIKENAVVVRRKRVGDGSAGTISTAVNIYDGAVLVEVSETGVVMLDMFVVLADRLDATWRVETCQLRRWKPDGSLNCRDRARRRSTAFP